MDVNTLPDTLRNDTLLQCGHCSKRRSEADVKLKRCNACHVVMYCSRECQKAAWPKHRDICRAVQAMKREDPPKHYAGYETPVLLVNAIRDWVAKQHDALRVLARCTVLTACNLQEVFATPDSTQVLIFHITPRPPPSANLNWNPGNAFNLDEILLFPMTVVRAIMPTTDADWKEWIEKCRSMTEEYHRVYPSNPNALPFVGVMPTIVMVETIRLTMLAFLPIHGTHHVTTPVEGSRRTPFDHIVDMCTWCVNEGCVLRIRDTKRPLHFEPDAGVYERTAGTGKWKWQVQKEFAWELFARYDKPNKAGDAETRVEENPFLSWGLFYNL